MKTHAEKVNLLQRLEDARLLLLIHQVMRESESKRIRSVLEKRYEKLLKEPR